MSVFLPLYFPRVSQLFECTNVLPTLLFNPLPRIELAVLSAGFSDVYTFYVDSLKTPLIYRFFINLQNVQ